MSEQLLVAILGFFGVFLSVIGGGAFLNWRRVRELRAGREREKEEHEAKIRELDNNYNAKLIELKQQADRAVDDYKSKLWEALEAQRDQLYKDIDERRENRILELRGDVHHWRNEAHIAKGRSEILQKEKDQLIAQVIELEKNITLRDLALKEKDHEILKMMATIEVLQKRLFEEEIDHGDAPVIRPQLPGPTTSEG